MTPRPFPQALSIGTDICHYVRFQKYFPVRQHSASTATAASSQKTLFKLFDKLFLPAEQRMFWRRFQQSSPLISDTAAPSSQQGYWDETVANEAARYIGGRWAAKEAVIKAFAAERRLTLRDVRVQSVGKSRQPVGVVLERVEDVKYASAKEVYQELVRRWGLRRELENLRQQGTDAASAAVVPSNRLRIIKHMNLDRGTARIREMAKRARILRQDQTPPTAQLSASSTSSNPPILSKSGILDLSAIHEILQQDEEISSAAAISSPSTPTSEADAKEGEAAKALTDSRRQRLEEEIQHSQGRERREDDWNSVKGQIVKLSISHDGEYCVATALAAV